CLAGAILMVVGLAAREPLPVSMKDAGLLVLFGAGQLAIGGIFFTIGARLIPAGGAALLGLLGCAVGAVWGLVFLRADPGSGAITGGLLTLAAVAGNTAYEMWRMPRGAVERSVGGAA